MIQYTTFTNVNGETCYRVSPPHTIINLRRHFQKEQARARSRAPANEDAPVAVPVDAPVATPRPTLIRRAFNFIRRALRRT